MFGLNKFSGFFDCWKDLEGLHVSILIILS